MKSTPDEEIMKNIKKVFKRKITVDKREEKLARINTPIDQTLKAVLRKIKNNTPKFDFILVVNVVCPFLNSNDFESAINIAKIFNTDEVIAVKKESDNFYKHDGNGLKLVQKWAIMSCSILKIVLYLLKILVYRILRVI